MRDFIQGRYIIQIENGIPRAFGPFKNSGIQFKEARAIETGKVYWVDVGKDEKMGIGSYE